MKLLNPFPTVFNPFKSLGTIFRHLWQSLTISKKIQPVISFENHFVSFKTILYDLIWLSFRFQHCANMRDSKNYKHITLTFFKYYANIGQLFGKPCARIVQIFCKYFVINVMQILGKYFNVGCKHGANIVLSFYSSILFQILFINSAILIQILHKCCETSVRILMKYFAGIVQWFYKF